MKEKLESEQKAMKEEFEKLEKSRKELVEQRKTLDQNLSQIQTRQVQLGAAYTTLDKLLKDEDSEKKDVKPTLVKKAK